jgi:hypothetical protein
MNCDHNYFEKIDCHEKAYWLGFIYADGSVFDKVLQIVIKDVGLLDHFKRALKAEHGVHEYRYASQKYSSIFRFAVTSPKIVSDLFKLGVVERKSLLLRFPNEEQVSSNFINSFMLGYFDGDGSISTYMPKIGSKKWNFSIISTENFCEKYKSILVEKCQLFNGKIIKYSRLPNKNIWQYNLCGVYCDRIERIYNFLYSDISFSLGRKRDRFLNIINNHPREEYTSKYYGVSKSFNDWTAQITIEGRNSCLGRFSSEEEAAKCFDSYLLKNNLDFRYLNFK